MLEAASLSQLSVAAALGTDKETEVWVCVQQTGWVEPACCLALAELTWVSLCGKTLRPKDVSSTRAPGHARSSFPLMRGGQSLAC